MNSEEINVSISLTSGGIIWERKSYEKVMGKESAPGESITRMTRTSLHCPHKAIKLSHNIGLECTPWFWTLERRTFHNDRKWSWRPGTGNPRENKDVIWLNEFISHYSWPKERWRSLPSALPTCGDICRAGYLPTMLGLTSWILFNFCHMIWEDLSTPTCSLVQELERPYLQ